MKTNKLFGRLCGSSFMATVLAACCVYVLTGCNPKISTNISKSYPTSVSDTDVVVIGLEQPVPEDAEVLGSVKIGGTGFTNNCDYPTVLEVAKLEARKVGGNAIKITEHKLPNPLLSTCHKITATILRLRSIDEYLHKSDAVAPKSDAVAPKVNAAVPKVDYAILNVYRFGGAGTAVSYDLHLGDSVICRVKNNYKATFHIKKSGPTTIWAKTEAKSEVTITLKPGQTYYLRCGVKAGTVVGYPQLELIDNKIGKSEFDAFKAKNQ